MALELSRVGILGGPGTFAWVAFRRFAAAYGWSCDVQYLGSVESLLASLSQGEIDATCLAIQTSHAGFTPLAHEVLRNPSLVPIAEAVLPYNCTLYVREGCDLGQVRLVLGHQSLELARHWLQKHLPNARLETRASTIEAAREVAQGEGGLAVVGSPALSEVVRGLRAQAHGIDGGVVGRWWVIGRQPVADPMGTRAVVSAYSVDMREASAFIAECVGRGLHLEGVYAEAHAGPEFRWDLLLLIEGDGSAIGGLSSQLRAAGRPFVVASQFRGLAVQGIQ